MKIELKVGRKLMKIAYGDLLVDDGTYILLLTHETRIEAFESFENGCYPGTVCVSQKLFKELSPFLSLYTDDSLIKYMSAHLSGNVTIYSFNVDDMAKVGYKVVEE